jgi:hypothetical protein
MVPHIAAHKSHQRLQEGTVSAHGRLRRVDECVAVGEAYAESCRKMAAYPRRRTNTPEPTCPLQTASLATFRGDALTDLLAGLAANSIGSFVNESGEFVIPGFVKMSVMNKPATEARSGVNLLARAFSRSRGGR